MITVRAHAKINLNLRILARRPDDGYHDLRTVFQALAVHDTLSLVSRPGAFVLEANDPTLPTDSRNLVRKAADLLWQHLGRAGEPRDVLVRIEKRIPMKGGLGGGSADAAAALLGLARLWDADVPVPDLLALGRRIGADVGFFFTGGAALGEGRGDQLQVLPDLPRLGVLLVVPRFDVSTADAYRWVDEERGWGRETLAGGAGSRNRESGIGNRRTVASLVPGSQLPAPRLPRCPWPEPLDEVANDFEDVIARRHPELREVKQAVAAAGADAVAMTGSGSTVFGLFTDEVALRRAAERLAGWPLIATYTLTRQEYLEQATPTEQA